MARRSYREILTTNLKEGKVTAQELLSYKYQNKHPREVETINNFTLVELLCLQEHLNSSVAAIVLSACGFRNIHLSVKQLSTPNCTKLIKLLNACDEKRARWSC